jgi:hypothetical protein
VILGISVAHVPGCGTRGTQIVRAPRHWHITGTDGTHIC